MTLEPPRDQDSTSLNGDGAVPAVMVDMVPALLQQAVLLSKEDQCLILLAEVIQLMFQGHVPPNLH